MTTAAIEKENAPPVEGISTPATVPAAKGGKTKKVKEMKVKKKPATAAPRKKSVSTHPSYEEMIKDAIVTLKERTGSSQYAIQKFIEEKHKVLSPSFRKLLLLNLKRLVASEKLVKIKASFKIPSSKVSSSPKAAVKTSAPVKKKPTTAVASKPKGKVTAASKPKGAGVLKKPRAVKPKTAPKPKATVAAKKKAVAAKPKSKERPAKAAKTAAVTSPGKKAVAAKKKAPVVAMKKKKTPVKKSVKPKTVKSPVKRASKRAKN